MQEHGFRKNCKKKVLKSPTFQSDVTVTLSIITDAAWAEVDDCEDRIETIVPARLLSPNLLLLCLEYTRF